MSVYISLFFSKGKQQNQIAQISARFYFLLFTFFFSIYHIVCAYKLNTYHRFFFITCSTTISCPYSKCTLCSDFTRIYIEKADMRTKTEIILQIIGYQHMFFFLVLLSFSLFHYSTNYVNKASIKKKGYTAWEISFVGKGNLFVGNRRD